MRTTLSLIKADVGAIAGHVKPSKEMMNAVIGRMNKSKLVTDFRVWHTGDDIDILMAHQRGKDDEKIHELAWDAFIEATEIAKSQGLYGAGQDLLKDTFSGNVKGMGPGVAEIEFDERPAEPFVCFAADKTDPGAFNLPLYLSFADPMHTAGLLLSPELSKGFKYTIMDVEHTGKDKVIELKAPEDLYRIAALLRDPERYVVEKIHSADGEHCVSVSTTRLHNIAGKYTGKDDPVCLVRTQKMFPAAGEVLSPYALCPYVAGFMRGSHTGPFMPVKKDSTISFFDGPPVVTALGFCVHHGKITGPVDLFEHPFWDNVRNKCSEKAIEIRKQGFFGNAMLPMSELEYGGITKMLEELESKFKLRE